MPRKIVTAIILVPLAVVIIAFAVANRQIVTVSFDPFSVTEPAAVVDAAAVRADHPVAHYRRADRRGRGMAAAEQVARDRAAPGARGGRFARKGRCAGRPGGRADHGPERRQPAAAAQAEAAGPVIDVARRRKTKRARRL